MKRTNILAIAVLLLMTLFISSCENEKLDPSDTPTEQRISPSSFITRSQSAVEQLNEVYRQHSDSELESRSGELTFEERWGQPNYDKIIRLNSASEHQLLIAPLEQTDTTRNLLVGWQHSDSIKLRIVHEDKTLSNQTFDNTAIIPAVPDLFDIYNNSEYFRETPFVQVPTCYIMVYGQTGFSFVPIDCDDNPTGTGGPLNDYGYDVTDITITNTEGDVIHGGSTGSNTGTTTSNNNSTGETTDPDCTGEIPGPGNFHVEPDDPDCAACLGIFDIDCDGSLDPTEACMEQAGSYETCCPLTPECSWTMFEDSYELAYSLSTSQRNYLAGNPTLMTEVISFLSIEERSQQEELEALQMMLDVRESGLMYGNYDQAYFNIINQYADNAINPYYHMLFTVEVALLKFEHQHDPPEDDDWSDEWIYMQAAYNVFMDDLHLALDLVGLIPAVGEIADITNGAIYTLEGDGLNAGLSFSAAIPIAGWFAAGIKFGKRTITTVTGTKVTLKYVVDPSTDIIYFGYRGQLKTVIKPAAGEQAHHIIPMEWFDHPVVQEAAKAGANPFHMHDHINGIALSTARHNGSHPNYNAHLSNELDAILQNYGGNINSADALNDITTLANNIRNTIIANPNTHINDLF